MSTPSPGPAAVASSPSSKSPSNSAVRNSFISSSAASKSCASEKKSSTVSSTANASPSTPPQVASPSASIITAFAPGWVIRVSPKCRLKPCVARVCEPSAWRTMAAPLNWVICAGIPAGNVVDAIVECLKMLTKNCS